MKNHYINIQAVKDFILFSTEENQDCMFQAIIDPTPLPVESDIEKWQDWKSYALFSKYGLCILRELIRPLDNEVRQKTVSIVMGCLERHRINENRTQLQIACLFREVSIVLSHILPELV